MKCPIDNTDLHITERQGIEIDYCPKCRGVWLDRGELDKIIDRAAAPAGAGAASASREAAPTREYREPAREYREPVREYREPRRDDDDDDYHRPRGSRKRRSFLDDLFDFD